MLRREEPVDSRRGVVWPYILVHEGCQQRLPDEQHQGLELKRERPRVLWLASDGFCMEPAWIHGVLVEAGR
ncbi:hypothetical protein [Streptomyces sp. NPDC019937]|uniref:hypothetical protein n=1 Tax=Streptomyces sp. NPDC019937 TaxID=3154787 RepID=UPI0033D1986E